MCVCLWVCVSVTISKLEYLRIQQAEFNQILSVASFGWGLIVLGFRPGRIGALVSMATNSSRGGRTGLMVRASDSGSGDPGSILGRVGVFVSFSHVETEPPIPGYYQYFWGVNVSCSRKQHTDPASLKTTGLAQAEQLQVRVLTSLQKMQCYHFKNAFYNFKF